MNKNIFIDFSILLFCLKFMTMELSKILQCYVVNVVYKVCDAFSGRYKQMNIIINII